ncbi:hypothetical protein R3P38DRAFT_2868981 [Favolaschia claudopus]|uniref:Uncharacterized protein n=1 Tax=Favolaschia claudopus TaxID=2862362 RepID=A0AAW0DBX1_9AGAR
MSSTPNPSASLSTAAATPVNKVDAVADKDASLVVSTPSLPSPKDVRAFEHDRQRVKKAADWVKTKERKEQGRWATLAKGEFYNSSRRNSTPAISEKQKRLSAEEVDPLDAPLADSGRDTVGVASYRATQPSEVKLGDLITFRKPRKARAGDFVVIPHHSVIVLDDITSHDLLADEPWDLLDDEEATATTPTKALSYAEILTAHTK